MATKMVGYRVGQIDCPYCYTVTQWDDPGDIHNETSENGTRQYILCSNVLCPGERIGHERRVYLDPNRDYYIILWEERKEEDDNLYSNLVGKAKAGYATI